MEQNDPNGQTEKDIQAQVAAEMRELLDRNNVPARIQHGVGLTVSSPPYARLYPHFSPPWHES